jgi:hypothetical protein
MLSDKQLADYAEKQRTEVTDFFKGYVGELPKLKMGCELLTNPDKFVSTNLERIKENPKSREVIAAFVRLKKYRTEIEKL